MASGATASSHELSGVLEEMTRGSSTASPRRATPRRLAGRLGRRIQARRLREVESIAAVADVALAAWSSSPTACWSCAMRLPKGNVLCRDVALPCPSAEAMREAPPVARQLCFWRVWTGRCGSSSWRRRCTSSRRRMAKRSMDFWCSIGFSPLAAAMGRPSGRTSSPCHHGALTLASRIVARPRGSSPGRCAWAHGQSQRYIWRNCSGAAADRLSVWLRGAAPARLGARKATGTLRQLGAMESRGGAAAGA